MSKIVTLKLEIPADDDVRVEDVKLMVRAAIHALGRVEATSGGEGQGTILDRATFFAAGSVKLWVTPARRAKAA